MSQSTDRTGGNHELCCTLNVLGWIIGEAIAYTVRLAFLPAQIWHRLKAGKQRKWGMI